MLSEMKRNQIYIYFKRKKERLKIKRIESIDRNYYHFLTTKEKTL